MPQSISTQSEDQWGTTVGSARLRIDEVESWIDTLPLGDVSETYSRVLSSLLKLNGSDFPSHERFEALELFRRPLQ